MIPVSSTVIPLPVYKVGYNLGFVSKDKKTQTLSKPEDGIKLITSKYDIINVAKLDYKILFSRRTLLRYFLFSFHIGFRSRYQHNALQTKLQSVWFVHVVQIAQAVARKRVFYVIYVRDFACHCAITDANFFFSQEDSGEKDINVMLNSIFRHALICRKRTLHL